MFAEFLFLGIFVHLLLLYSIFDIYYSSPIVKVGRNFKIIPNNSNNSLAPADRLVFFSADGLRANSFFDNPERSPFLHSLIYGSKAVWGISESHVPTESRPGHVALFAGFYEDVSAVTRGWKSNPIPFDSTFNQTKFSFLWGSPDIINLFSKNIPHTYSDVYSPELEDFASEDASQLDKWVFQRVEEFFLRSNDTNIKKLLSIKQSIYFLHLLGLDTNGHGNKPNSEQYLENIRIVDKGIERIVNLFENYFNDKRTVYLFTSDHGMTDWGSHGDGSPNEIQTPLIIWGSGITSHKFNLINQVDITPLQSTLLGISIPFNSFGIIPIQLLLNNLSNKYIFSAVYANFKQMSEQFLIRRADIRAHSFRFLFSEYSQLSFDGLIKIENEILRLAQLKRYEAAWKACIKLIPLIRSALNYFHPKDWLFVLFFVVGIFNSSSSSLQLYLPKDFLFIILLIIFSIIWANGWSLINYFYFLTPIYLFSIGIKLFNKNNYLIIGKLINLNLIIKGILFVFSIFLLVYVFFQRFTLCLIFLLISPFWIFKNILNKKNYIKLDKLSGSNEEIEDINDVIYSNKLFKLTKNEFTIRERQFRREEQILFDKTLLFSSCVIYDTVGNIQRPLFVIFAQIINLIFIIYLFNYFNKQKIFFFIAFLLHFLNFLLILFDYFEFQFNKNLIIKLFAWSTIPIAFIFPILLKKTTKNNLNIQLIFWNIFIQIPYNLLSISHEALFFCLFSSLLFVYFKLETDVLKISTFETTFFGTGNISSLNSFNPSFLRHFITIFSPFIMAILLLLKIFFPFLLISLYFISSIFQNNSFVNKLNNKIIIKKLSTIVAIIINNMAMIFFYCLKTEGSWLQIGISISNYVICLVCSIVTYILLYLANWLIL
ncbi:Sulfatase domain-containing protein [Meloidogyne graminicola]|uniref:GPI ethanolamine phosphate transferase 1 n=1 Tax=Meloidogyne graminicola TaxID=189291 RepID=A0A8S9ZKV6_9BILA|nr:Sulfatase domain-containing protein [Meloidogyne graminicola]